MKLLEWTKGKKTYLTIAVGVALGVYQGVTGHDVPSYVYLGLGLLGLGFHRSALTDQTKKITELVEAVAGSILTQITVPDPQPVAVNPVLIEHTVVPVVPTVSITVGKPSPKTVSEEQVTDALNAAQLKH